MSKLTIIFILFLFFPSSDQVSGSQNMECDTAVYVKECEEAGGLIAELEVQRAMGLTMSAYIESNCSIESTEYWWQFHKNADDTLFKTVNLTNIFVLEPFEFPNDEYIVLVHIRFTRDNQKWSLEEKPAGCVIHVLAADPIAVISGGSEITIEPNEKLVLDGSQSIDHNVPPGAAKHLSYNWTCEVLKGTNREFCNKAYHDAKLEVPAQYILDDHKYQFTLEVENVEPKNLSISRAKKIVEIKKDVAELEITCKKNCPPISPYVNPNEITYLEVICLKHCERINANSFFWTINETTFDYEKNTQYGRSTNNLIIKKGSFKPDQSYMITVETKTPSGKAVKVLTLPTSLSITSCNAIPNQGIAGVTKFKIECVYVGTPHIFEVYLQSYLLSQWYHSGAMEVLLPANPNVSLKATTIEGVQDTCQLNIRVDAATKVPKDLNSTVTDLIEKDSLDAAIQLVNSLADLLDNNTRNDLYGILGTASEKSTPAIINLVAGLVVRLLNNTSTSDPNRGVTVTEICKNASIMNLDGIEGDFEEHVKTLIACGEPDTRGEDFKAIEPVQLDFDISTQFPVLDVPVITENYPDYDDFDVENNNKQKYEEVTENIVEICKNNLDLMSQKVVEGEQTVVVESDSSSAQITKMIGRNLKEIQMKGLSFKPSLDFQTIEEIVDVMVCVWEYDPFWWSYYRIQTNVVLLKIQDAEKKKDLDNFREPNRLIFNLQKDKKNKFEIRKEKVVLLENSTIKIGVPMNQDFSVHFYDFDPSVKVLITNFDKPDLEKIKEEGSNLSSVFFQQELNGFDSWYYLSFYPVGNFTLSVITKSCFAWHSDSQTWNVSCKGTSNEDPNKIDCSCTKFSILAGVVYQNPFTIDTFNLVEYEMVLLRSWIIFLSTVIVFLIYSCLLIYQLTKEKEKMIYLPGDISTNERYMYLVEISTGRKNAASTTSNIFIQIFGEKHDSQMHFLNYPDPQRKLFQYGSTDWFVIPTSFWLGTIKELSIWSDYRGRKPKWYCSQIILYDLQIGDKWYFHVGKWFGLPPQHQLFVKVAPIAPKQEKKRKWWHNIGFSTIPKRTYQASLGYVKRLSLVLLVVYLVGFYCLVLYGLPTLQLNDGFSEFNEFTVHWKLLVFGVGSALCTFPIHALVILTSRLKKCKIVGCTILVFLLGGTIATLVVFGFWVPEITGYHWLVSCIVALLFYIFIIENVLEFIFAFFDKHSDDLMKQIKRIQKNIEMQRWYLFPRFGENLLRNYFKSFYKPLNEEDMKERYFHKGYKKKLYMLLQDSIMFICYIIFLFMAIYANKNPMEIYNHHEVLNLLKGSHSGTLPFTSVTSFKNVYDYLNQTLVPTIHNHEWYSGFNLPDPGTMADLANKMLGIVRIRQLRVVPTKCQVPPYLDGLVSTNGTCRAEFFWSEEDKTHFGKEDNVKRLSQVWDYTPAKSAGYTVYIGKFGWYPGGGYVAPLGRTWYNSNLNLFYLRNNSWLEGHTVCVVVDFLSYNVNTNLFNAVKLVFERSVTGYFRSKAELRTTQLLFVNAQGRLQQQIIFGLFFIAVFVFTVNYFVRLWQGKLSFLKDIWSIIDFVLLGFTYATLVLALYRARSLKKFLHNLESTKKNEFILYFTLLYEDMTFIMLAALLIFMSTVRLWKICRFAKLFLTMEKTIILALPSILWLSLIHMVLILAFALSGYCLFNCHSYSFKNVLDSIILIILILMGYGSFDLQTLVVTNPVLSRSYHFGNSLVNKFFNSFYVAIMMSFYYEACCHSDPVFATQVKSFLFGEFTHCRTFLRTGLVRLKGGRSKSKVIPKEDSIRYNDCIVLDRLDLEIMRWIAILRLKRKRNKSEAMKQIALFIFKNHNKENNELFYKMKGDKKVRIIPDLKMELSAKAAELILGGKFRKGKKKSRELQIQLYKIEFFLESLRMILNALNRIHIE